MPGDQTGLALEEYHALRATIRERGSLRLLVILLTIVAWAALALAVLALPRPAGLTLVPLLVLAAGFEVVFAAHVGVERIGRYVQVRLESAEPGTGPAWEQTAMALGRSGRATGGIDPIARRLFAAATMVNLLPAVRWIAISAHEPLDWLVLVPEALAHALVLARLSFAARYARSQREEDLAALRQLSRGGPRPGQ